MILLDHSMMQQITNMCVICSSIGCWIALYVAEETAFIVWIGGYIACRTVIEMIDVLLQYFIIAWHISPDLIYEPELNLSESWNERSRQFRTLYGDHDGEQKPAIVAVRTTSYVGDAAVTYQKTGNYAEVCLSFIVFL